MTRFHGMKIKAETAEEIEGIQTANGIRERILEASFHDPLIRRVMDIARLNGFSGEDTYVFLAYYALVAKEELTERIMDDLNNRPSPPFLILGSSQEGR